MKHMLPFGLENSIQEYMSPDMQLSFKIVSAHKRTVNKQWSYPKHQHAMFELNYVIEGEQRMLVQDELIHVQSGQILFIPPQVEHASLGTGNEHALTYFCLHFDIDDLTLRRSLRAKATTLLCKQQEPLVGELHKALARIMNSMIFADSKLRRDKLSFISDILHLLSLLAAWCMQEESNLLLADGTSEKEVSLALAIENAIEQADLTNRSNHEQGTIEQIAKQLGYTSAHCKRIFLKVFGITPRQYLTESIIRKAKLFLMNPDHTIEEIALALGYRDLSQFSKQFKRWMGVSPSQYRKLN